MSVPGWASTTGTVVLLATSAAGLTSLATRRSPSVTPDYAHGKIRLVVPHPHAADDLTDHSSLAELGGEKVVGCFTALLA
jgi:hypothetical protein